MRREKKPLRERLAVRSCETEDQISIRRVNAKSGFTNNVVWKILLRSRAPCRFARNLRRYNLGVKQEKLVARTSFTVSSPNSAQETRVTRSKPPCAINVRAVCLTVNMLTHRPSQYAD